VTSPSVLLPNPQPSMNISISSRLASLEPSTPCSSCSTSHHRSSQVTAATTPPGPSRRRTSPLTARRPRLSCSPPSAGRPHFFCSPPIVGGPRIFFSSHRRQETASSFSPRHHGRSCSPHARCVPPSGPRPPYLLLPDGAPKHQQSTTYGYSLFSWRIGGRRVRI
jgi:hypothetical protein